jgi:polysaccharide export outer membrane protein
MGQKRLICALLTLVTGALGTPADTGPAAEYRIGPEDVLRIAVWKNEALSQVVPVRPDGMISLPLLNDVRAAGLTPMELKRVLAQKLKEYMPEPEVSVIVQEIHSPKISVIGEVTRPGRYDLRSRTTVLDALAQAGGLREFAARSKIVVLRPNGRGTERIRFDYDRAVANGKQENFGLLHGDVVVVP